MASAAQKLESVEVIKKRQGKRFSESVKVLREKASGALSYQEGIQCLLDLPKTKFDQTLDVAFRLGVDPKQSDQMVRGAVVLPHGLGKDVRILVFAKGDKLKEAEAAGANFVGADELVEKISGGWTDFDSVVATPDMMPVVSKVARVLGPKGLMPNPKLGTVTMDVTKVIGELKMGRCEFRVDKNAVIHAPVGKLSSGAEKLAENFKILADTLKRMKPSTTKGTYFRSVYLSSSMGPSVQVDVSSFGGNI
jgi:large subunit ribosomal protein L1